VKVVLQVVQKAFVRGAQQTLNRAAWTVILITVRLTSGYTKRIVICSRLEE
jgi:hypothetical protein